MVATLFRRAIIIIGSLIVLFTILPTMHPRRAASLQYTCMRNYQEIRPVNDSTVDFSELWNIEMFIANTRSGGDRILIKDNILIVLDIGCRQVVAFDMVTGTVIWEKLIEGEALTEDPQQDDVIYVTESSGSARRIWALQVSTGREIWVNEDFNGRRVGLSIRLDSNNRLLLYVGGAAFADGGIFVVNRETGMLEELSNLPHNTLLVDQNAVWYQNGCSLEARTINSRQLLWSWCSPPTTSLWRLRPLISGNFMIVQNGGEVSFLYLLDWHTGHILWFLDDVVTVSNVAENEDYFYVLTDTAKLLMLDKASGEVLESVQFERPETTYDGGNLLVGPGLIGGSWLAVSERVVVIYFQDSGVLSVIEISQ